MVSNTLLTMWIDFKKENTNPFKIMLLQMIHQNQKEDLKEVVDFWLLSGFLTDFQEKGWIEFIKGKKGDSEANRARLTKKGRQHLEDILETSE